MTNKIYITDREITKDELKTIYDDFKTIDRENGIPNTPQVRYQYIAEQNGKAIGFASGLTKVYPIIGGMTKSEQFFRPAR